jgi:hypothetical protein
VFVDEDESVLGPLGISRRDPVPPADPSAIYFILNGDLVKIGWTRNVRQRLASLRAMAGTPMVLLGTVPTTWKEAWPFERTIHDRFKAARQHGEWFAVSRQAVEEVILELGGRLGDQG